MWSTRIGEPKPSATSQPPRRGVGARRTAATSNAGVAKARLSRSLGRSMLAINRAHFAVLLLSCLIAPLAHAQSVKLADARLVCVKLPNVDAGVRLNGAKLPLTSARARLVPTR